MTITRLGRTALIALGIVALSGCIRFAPGVDHATSTNPSAQVDELLHGDFTGDGGEDVLVATGGVFTRLDVCGPDCLAAHETLTPGAGAKLGVADFDGDGIADFAAGGRIYFGGAAASPRPDGLTADDSVAFTLPPGYTVVYVDDFTGDGRADVIGKQSYMSFYYGYSIAVGDGAGGFAAWRELGLTAANVCDCTAIGDPDGDGIKELAVYSPLGLAVINGEDSSYTQYSIGGPSGLFFGDIDGDGRDDLATGGFVNGAWEFRFLRSTATGFTPFPHYDNNPKPTGPTSPLLRDIDGDGLADLRFVDSTGWVWRSGSGDGGFPYQPTGAIPPQTAGDHFDFADIDGDGYPEVVRANGTGHASISVYTNTSYPRH